MGQHLDDTPLTKPAKLAHHLYALRSSYWSAQRHALPGWQKRLYQSDPTPLSPPAGLLHFMKNGDCNNSLKMLTTFNDADAGELTMLDKIFGFDDNTVMAATGLDQVGCTMMLGFHGSLTSAICGWQAPHHPPTRDYTIALPWPLHA